MSKYKDRRVRFLYYGYGSRPGDCVVGHLCSPGLSGAVRRYIKKTYGEVPETITRHRTLCLDLGGMAILDPPVILQMDGWKVSILPCHIPGVLEAMTERLRSPPKDYLGMPAYRWSTRYGMILMDPETTLNIIERLEPPSTSTPSGRTMRG
tara:strand:+ start:5551 stop:6003 length:453 start_codon:yes stop_codon:yes gene_type:complete